MSGYNITGWSGGGRRPLTYNLMPGQFRNTRVNIFPSQTIINNNIGNFGGCFDYGDCCCGGGDKTPSWMNWMMGIGMGTSLLGGILSMFGIGGGKSAESTEGAGEAKQKPKTDDSDLKNLKTLYPNHNIVKMEDGTYVAKPKNGGKSITAKTAAELMEKLDAKAEKPATTTTTQAENSPTQSTASPVTTSPFTMQLFKAGEFADASAEEAKFEELTGQKVFTLGDNFSEITIEKLIDKGSPADKDIDDVKITKNADGTLACNPAEVNGKAVSAEILGNKYIRLTVGEQTYIVAKNNNAYQYQDGNVTGFDVANWTTSLKKATDAPPPKRGNKTEPKTATKNETKWQGIPYKLPDASSKVATKTVNNTSELSPKAQEWEDRAPKSYFKLSSEEKQAISAEAAARKDNTPYKAKLYIRVGQKPTAIFTDKNGKTHKFIGRSGGMSFSHSTRQTAEINNVKEQIRNAGFTNVTLENAY